MLNMYCCVIKSDLEKIIEYFIEFEEIIKISNKLTENTNFIIIDSSIKKSKEKLEEIKNVNKIRFVPITFFNVSHSYKTVYNEQFLFSTVFDKNNSLEFILKEISCVIKSIVQVNNGRRKFVKLMTNKKEICLLQDEIIFIESGRNKTIVHTANDSINCKYIKICECKKTLGNEFVVCHRSFAVNKNHISAIKITERTIKLANNKYSVSIGRVYKEQFLNEIGML